eukprot:gene32575-biopygen11925
MVGNVPRLTTLKKQYRNGAPTEPDIIIDGDVLYIPLQFWFCRSIGLSLPLIALQYHEVKINIELREAKDCCYFGKIADAGGVEVYSDPSVPMPVGSLNASLYVDYMYLDTDERRRFAQFSHEYLIEQLQFTGDESTSQQPNKLKLNFNHPVKFLVWDVQPDDHIAGPIKGTGDSYANYAQGSIAAGGSVNTFITSYFGHGDNPTDNARLQLNGHDRMAERCDDLVTAYAAF